MCAVTNLSPDLRGTQVEVVRAGDNIAGIFILDLCSRVIDNLTACDIVFILKVRAELLLFGTASVDTRPRPRRR